MVSRPGAERYLDDGDFNAAAGACVAEYGPEVLGYLSRVLRHEQDAEDAFAQACVELWEHLPRYERRCSLRSWFYTLARHAAFRLKRAPQRRRPHVGDSTLAEAVARVRTETLPHLLTANKTWLANMRDELNEEDCTLLVLRVDRQLSWAEIAQVFAGPEGQGSNVAREEARLRKRFQLLKQELRERARALGEPEGQGGSS